MLIKQQRQLEIINLKLFLIFFLVSLKRSRIDTKYLVYKTVLGNALNLYVS